MKVTNAKDLQLDIVEQLAVGLAEALSDIERPIADSMKPPSQPPYEVPILSQPR